MYQYSSTERNNQLDEFLSPSELIDACIEQAVVPLCKLDNPTILDVGANDGRWGRAARKYYPNAVITGVEIMNMPQPEGFDVWYPSTDFIGDSSVHEPFYGNHLPGFDLIIGNPPYRVKDEKGKMIYKAEDFVRYGCALLKKDGHLFYLLRSNFVHSVERYWWDGKRRTKPGLWQTHHLYKVWFTVLRPSFFKEDPRTAQYGTKQTNAHDYSLFAWKKGYAGDFSGGWLDWTYKGDNM